MVDFRKKQVETQYFASCQTKSQKQKTTPINKHEIQTQCRDAIFCVSQLTRSNTPF